MPKKNKSFIAPASLWRRFFAFLIDLFILDMIVLFPFQRVLESYFPQGGSFKEMLALFQSESFIYTLLMLSVFSSFITIIYFSYFEYKIQQTPGKMIFKIFAVSEVNPSFFAYFFSNLIFLSFIPLISLLWVFDIAHIFFSPKHQRFLEKIARIIVIQKYVGEK